MGYSTVMTMVDARINPWAVTEKEENGHDKMGNDIVIVNFALP